MIWLHEKSKLAPYLSHFILGKIHLIRYEDLSLDPFNSTDNLLRFLDLPPNRLIENFIEEHTMITRNGNSLMNSTNHSSKQTSCDKY